MRLARGAFCREAASTALPPAVAAGAFLLALLSPAPARADYSLTLLLLDAASGAPTEARVSVTGSDLSSRRPLPDSLCLYQSPLGGYFYADSAATILVPAGSTRVRAAKGPEFRRFADTLDIQADTTVVVELDHWIEPRTLGWVGGETHAHLAHPPIVYHLDAEDARLLLKAEGVRVATFLETEDRFTGAVDPLSDSDAVFFIGEEYRSPIFGHLGLLGIDSFRNPPWGQLGWPLNADITQEIRGHAHSLVSFAHPATTTDYFNISGWPGTGLAREIWVDAALGRLDAVDLLSYSNGAVPGFVADTLWHRLWNCGFAVPGLAGTDASPGRGSDYPIGALRAYARVADPYAPPGELYEAWIESARRGRTFVTTGPIITAFDVGGVGAGETLDAPGGMPLDVSVHARFEWVKNLRYIQVIRNGVVLETHWPSNTPTYELWTTVPVRETSWITVRHDGWPPDDFGPPARSFAEPTPALVALTGDGLTSASSGAYALARIELLDSLLGLEGNYPTEEESLATALAIETGRAVWSDRADAPPGAFLLVSPCDGCSTGSTPLFAWEPSPDPDPGSVVSYRIVIARDANFEDPILDTSGIFSTAWTPDDPLAGETRYWWRVRASDEEGASVWASEIDRWFETGIETGVESGIVRSPLSIVASPSPARGQVVFRTNAALGVTCELSIFAPSGRLVRSLLFPADERSLAWNRLDRAGAPVPPGVYLFRLNAPRGPLHGRLCIVR